VTKKPTKTNEMPLSYRAAGAHMDLFMARKRIERNPNDAAARAILADVEVAYLIMDDADAAEARLAAMPAWLRSLQ
jgi:hypothetical protein